MDSMSRVQNLDETVGISLHANALGKGMNPSHLTLDELAEPIGLCCFGWQLV